MQTTGLAKYTVRKVQDGLVKSPSFLEGRFGTDVFAAYDQARREDYQGNPNLKLQMRDGVVVGSNFFDTVLVQQLIRNGNVQGNPRTASLRDLSDPEILEMARGKYYIESQGLALRSTTDSLNARNTSLARDLVERLGVEESSLQREPALVTGFDLDNWPEHLKDSYGLRLVPESGKERFGIVRSDKLTMRYNGWWFTKVDENGIPSDLSKEKQAENAIKWVTGERSLSRLCLGGGLSLGSGWSGLGGSDSVGRVVVLSGEATDA